MATQATFACVKTSRVNMKIVEPPYSICIYIYTPKILLPLNGIFFSFVTKSRLRFTKNLANIRAISRSHHVELEAAMAKNVKKLRQHVAGLAF